MSEAANKRASRSPAPETWSDAVDQALRFLGVGVINTAWGYGVFAAMYMAVGGDVVPVVVATICGATFNFFTTGRLVFGSNGNGRVIRFAAGHLIVCAYNILALKGIVAIGVTPLIGQLIVLPTVAVLAFLINKFWVFR